MKPLVRYLELILTGVGIILVLLIFDIFRKSSPWKAAAICAVAVGIVHGIIFYIVRSKQRKARHQEVFSIRTMLDDMIKNRLNVVLYPAEPEDDWHARAQLAVWEIQARLNYIEDESFKKRQFDPQKPRA